MPRTTFLWICREETTFEALQGLLKLLTDQEAVRYSTIKIMSVSKDRPVAIPAGFTDPKGQCLPAGAITVDNCPAAGLLVLAEEED
ncbi:hypothetical protein [Blastococcus goldschmidtiae]|uniref:Uncharacterized protein n=1 Tax=Blastococcus goldschmidtiae TaxID=3075546 RepID=A0ABU2K6W6_9ACTN|nr:hypothetical protein [Blastococcus sp. DSM 46792]MDT0275937.1 hypothetical protein [Blastococcus sp. DSM 46792]